ncbi:tripartite tricarboxylate transporter TctB family protein [Granulosicoccus sp. 3-233]|uniref:tripartite tricarboxylate transporter TctB family protein n=1 Tax=Granulosicoccus sp. 3-233 TaxID=3417969 RepID=UPI003D32A4EB
MKKINNADTYLGGISLLLGVIFLVISYKESATVFVLQGDAPPFLVPQIYLFLWIAISVALLLGGLLGKGTPIPTVDKKRLVSVIGCVAIGAVLMKYIGFVFAGAISVIGTCILLAYRKIWIVFLTGILSGVLVWALLSGFADMPLPTFPGMRF